ncbi:hypothetical protein OUZ56_000057 [Daphnia magna]|uniref:Uncharacterized protein n=1 Tax=Daphnia magna TaxID=35525 RepID=A0ABQ9ZYK1_9CRUS|nr:hypothetical protein OUZ56_000057 [Daphnia magna]
MKLSDKEGHEVRTQSRSGVPSGQDLELSHQLSNVDVLRIYLTLRINFPAPAFVHLMCIGPHREHRCGLNITTDTDTPMTDRLLMAIYI